MSLKKVSIANFNTVFSINDEEHPLLEYFDTILMPALNSGIIRTIHGDKYSFMNIQVIVDDESNYILTGLIVKKTILEVKSTINEFGELVELDNKYPSAPFSIFEINLKNHRMIFVENQKGSPRLDTFRSTVKHVVDKYIRDYNSSLDDDSKKLPTPLVNVIGIPPRKSIEWELEDVVKIKKLTLKFYPLNGDGDVKYTGVYNNLITDFRKMIGSKTGGTSFNSPNNIPGVIDLISNLNGTAEPILDVEDKNKTIRKIRNDEISERMEMNITDSSLDNAINDILTKGKNIDSFTYTSEENFNIYESFLYNINR